jgi:uncharacterized protein YecE (DUF72 family)
LLRVVAAAVQGLSSDTPAFCIFDNTARGAATPNALAVQALLREGPA